MTPEQRHNKWRSNEKERKGGGIKMAKISGTEKSEVIDVFILVYL
jgi:hypothetical protein